MWRAKRSFRKLCLRAHEYGPDPPAHHCHGAKIAFGTSPRAQSNVCDAPFRACQSTGHADAPALHALEPGAPRDPAPTGHGSVAKP